eukprot:5795548-Alexandrium_andersonii.AAC.1
MPLCSNAASCEYKGARGARASNKRLCAVGVVAHTRQASGAKGGRARPAGATIDNAAVAAC